jgi:DNA-binding transcriptional ArsR family regulator
VSDQAAPIFAALGDPTRIYIVSRLSRDGRMSIARLTHGTSISRQAVTKHLHALESAGLVMSERAGREVLWSVRSEQLNRARRYLDKISAQWDSALERLRKTVEE